MVYLARENLWHDKVKLALSVFGVVVAVFLVLTTVGLYNGMGTSITDSITRAGADLWVTSKGTSGSVHSPSLLDLNTGEKLKQIEGVAEVEPLIRRPIVTNLSGKSVLIIVDGFDTATGMGGPWNVIEGSSRPNTGEIIIDKVLAKQQGLNVGGNINLGDKQFKIVGISDDTYDPVAYTVFVTLDDASTYLPEGLTNFFLIKARTAAEINQVKASISEALPDVSVRSTSESARAIKNEVVGGFLPIVLVISLIGMVVGILVVGLTIYTMTVEKSREYGVVRALGSTNAYFYRIVLFQSLTVSLMGGIIGAVVSPPLASLLRLLVPEFVVVISPQMIGWSIALFAGVGLIAAFIPSRRISRIDPAVVFKGA